MEKGVGEEEGPWEPNDAVVVHEKVLAAACWENTKRQESVDRMVVEESAGGPSIVPNEEVAGVEDESEALAAHRP